MSNVGKTRVMPCSCRHVNQDEMYGKGQRLHNGTLKTPGSVVPGWRCTVCGAVRVGGGS